MKETTDNTIRRKPPFHSAPVVLRFDWDKEALSYKVTDHIEPARQIIRMHSAAIWILDRMEHLKQRAFGKYNELLGVEDILSKQSHRNLKQSSDKFFLHTFGNSKVLAVKSRRRPVDLNIIWLQTTAWQLWMITTDFIERDKRKVHLIQLRKNLFY